jgi:hypothetical protein
VPIRRSSTAILFYGRPKVLPHAAGEQSAVPAHSCGQVTEALLCRVIDSCVPASAPACLALKSLGLNNQCPAGHALASPCWPPAHPQCAKTALEATPTSLLAQNALRALLVLASTCQRHAQAANPRGARSSLQMRARSLAPTVGLGARPTMQPQAAAIRVSGTHHAMHVQQYFQCTAGLVPCLPCAWVRCCRQSTHLLRVLVSSSMLCPW